MYDRDIEGGGAEGARRVAGPHRDGLAGREIGVKATAVGDTDDAGVRVDRKAAGGIVIEGIGDGSAVDVAGERRDADFCSRRRALDDRVRLAVHIGGRARRHIRDADGQVLLKAVAGGIGDLHRDGVGLGGFVVDRLRQNQIGARHRKAAAGVVDEGEGGGVATVGVDRRQSADHRADLAVLGDRRVRQRDVGRRAVRRIVGRRVLYLEGGGAEGARRIAGAHRDGVAGREIGVEAAAVGDSDDAGVRVDRETAARIVIEGIGDGSAVDVAGLRRDADFCSRRRALDDRVRLAVHIGGRARRHIRDADGQVLLKAVAGGIGDLDRDGLGLSGFVVDRLGQNQVGAGHRKVRRRRRRPGRR